VLSDLDFLVVLPDKNLLSAVLKQRQYQKKILEIEHEVAVKCEIDISIGFANASRKYWSMATPFMLELRENGLVLDGDPDVKNWPEIQSSNEIPSWEGARLVANRVCELLGEISKFTNLHSEEMLKLRYACLKLALSCSEATLINMNMYKSTYRERQHQQSLVSNRFLNPNDELLQAAYQAKLGQDPGFFSLGIQNLIRDLLHCSAIILNEMGIKDHSDWGKRGWSERSSFIGLGTDILFFAESLFRGKIVASRHAIMGVYADAMVIGKKIADQNTFPYNEESHIESRNLYARYKSTPQFVSVIESGRA
jgi:hypothetical protein